MRRLRFEHGVCVSFIPTSTDTGVHRTALLFAMRVCAVYMMCVCILGIHELCLKKIWLYNLPPMRVDAGSCVMHI